MEQHAPPEVPDFDLLRPVGSGGFGEVWLATNRTTRKLCAVKVIPLPVPGKGDRHLLCEAPGGPFRQKEPVPFPRPPARSVRWCGWRPICAAGMRTCWKSITWARQPRICSM